MAAANPQLTRQARRLYCGNLPVGMGLTESILAEFFNATVRSLGVQTPNPVLSTWMSSEGTFCVCSVYYLIFEIVKFVPLF